MRLRLTVASKLFPSQPGDAPSAPRRPADPQLLPPMADPTSSRLPARASWVPRGPSSSSPIPRHPCASDPPSRRSSSPPQAGAPGDAPTARRRPIPSSCLDGRPDLEPPARPTRRGSRAGPRARSRDTRAPPTHRRVEALPLAGQRSRRRADRTSQADPQLLPRWPTRPRAVCRPARRGSRAGPRARPCPITETPCRQPTHRRVEALPFAGQPPALPPRGSADPTSSRLPASASRVPRGTSRSGEPDHGDAVRQPTHLAGLAGMWKHRPRLADASLGSGAGPHSRASTSPRHRAPPRHRRVEALHLVGQHHVARRPHLAGPSSPVGRPRARWSTPRRVFVRCPVRMT